MRDTINVLAPVVCMLVFAVIITVATRRATRYYEQLRAAPQSEQEPLGSRMAEEDAQEFAKFYCDLCQYDPGTQFKHMEAQRLFQFARGFEHGGDDRCEEQVDSEEQAS